MNSLKNSALYEVDKGVFLLNFKLQIGLMVTTQKFWKGGKHRSAFLNPIIDLTKLFKKNFDGKLFWKI